METTARAALTQLVDGDTTIINGVPCEREPLIKLLRDMRYPSLGKGAGRGGGDGTMLNTAALDLYEHIDGTARAALNTWGRDHAGELPDVLTRMHTEIGVAAADWMTPDDADRMYGKFTTWQAQIEELIDPPHVKEITGECQACGVASYVDDDDVSHPMVLFAKVKPGYAVTVECRVCGKIWIGDDQLRELATAVGAEIDFVALRELDTETRDET